MSSNGSCRSESESGDEGEGDAYENVVPAGDDKNGVDGYRSGDTMENVDGQIADGTGCHIVNGEAGLSSGASDGIDYVELDFTERQLMEKDAAENEYNSHDDKDQFSETDTDHVGELEKSTEHESQADGDAAKESIAPTIVFVNPPTIPDIPSDNGNVVGNGAASIEVDSRFTPGGKTSVSLLSQPAGYTNGQNMISSENTLISGISNGAPPESSNAYYSNVTTHQELVDRGFIVVHPPGSSLMNNVPSGKTNIPTSYAKNMPILGTSDATAHGRIYQPNGGSRVISNGHATVVRIGAGGIVNGGVANVYRPTLPQNGATLEKIRQAAHNGGATILTIDTHRKAGKNRSGSIVFTPGVQAETESAPSRVTDPGQRHTQGQRYANGKRHQDPATDAAKRPVVGNDIDKPPVNACTRPCVVVLLVVSLTVVLGVAVYFILLKTGRLD